MFTISLIPLKFFNTIFTFKYQIRLDFSQRLIQQSISRRSSWLLQTTTSIVFHYFTTFLNFKFLTIQPCSALPALCGKCLEKHKNYKIELDKRRIATRRENAKFSVAPRSFFDLCWELRFATLKKSWKWLILNSKLISTTFSELINVMIIMVNSSIY